MWTCISLLVDAARTGSDAAASILGDAFYRGECGLPKDVAQANKWFAKVADAKFHHLPAEFVDEAARRAQELSKLKL